jgi:hypothetical protein
MRYWWVNQNQTYRQEIDGGYMWSPKVSKNGKLNPFYEFMREVAAGDLIFSFADTRIKAVGIALSPCYDCAKPMEFGAAGRVWGDTGWRVDVRWRELREQVKPKDHMEFLSPFLPTKYSPLQATGSGLQGIYLTELPDSLADALVQIMGKEAAETRQIARSYVSDVADPTLPAQAQAEWEEDLAKRVEQDSRIPVTEKRQVILARRGQGEFRKSVSKIERACRITQVNRPEHLIASHCKPWRDCESNDERLDGENGLLLTPTVDHLFDRGFISFENNGDLLVSPVVHKESLKRMGIPPDERRNVGAFSEGQRQYLEYHRDSVFLEARVRRE